jgi:putative tricarboxylic transport membrane protein
MIAGSFVSVGARCQHSHMTLARWIMALTLCAVSAGSAAQAWSPQKNVELIISTAPGGTNDKTARVLQRIVVENKLLSSTLTVVNKPGAAGAVANAYVNQHPGDPHYVFIGTPGLIGQHILGVSASSHKDFTLVASLFNDYVVMAVNANSPVKNGKDLIERLRTSPQSLTIGFAASLGNHHHITAGLLMKAVGGNVRALKLVVFKGSAEAITALLGGHIDVVSTGAVNAVAHVAGGKLRVIGVAAPQRFSGALANASTWKEHGADVVYGNWRALVGPPGLSPAHVTYWENVLNKVTETAAWRTELESNYWSSYFFTGQQLMKNLDREYAETKSVMADIGLIK